MVPSTSRLILFFFLFLPIELVAQRKLDPSKVNLTYISSQIDSLKTTKADKSTTRSGYGITDAEGTIPAGSVGQYWRGDKTWQPLNLTTVGGSNLNNTSDANKPVSIAQQEALDLKLNISNAEPGLLKFDTYALAVAGLAGRTKPCRVLIKADEVNNAGQFGKYDYDGTTLIEDLL